ncbi:MAG: bifunctional nuclease family protein [Anaerolineaceae bacterium]|nr:bifunctional nuclease family protein [Anaerolineaceae bacterium]
MSKMVEVIIDSVRVSLTNQQRIVVLKDIDQERYLPIWIGPYEAEAITISLQEIEVARPQTHDLLKNIITNLGARLLRVEVLSLKEDVFYGNLVIDVNGDLINIDSRPSDALAIAVRTHVPIFVALEIMESAAIIPEEELEGDEDPIMAEEETEGEESEGTNRLSVFEDFLQNLDVDEGSGLSADDEDDDDDDDDDSEDPQPDI